MTQPPSGDTVNYGPSSENLDAVDNSKDTSNHGLLKTSFDSSCQSYLHPNVEDGPFDGLVLWHASIRSDFKEVLDKLYKVGSKKFSSLASLLVRINFLTDVLIFYR